MARVCGGVPSATINRIRITRRQNRAEEEQSRLARSYQLTAGGLQVVYSRHFTPPSILPSVLLGPQTAEEVVDQDGASEGGLWVINESHLHQRQLQHMSVLLLRGSHLEGGIVTADPRRCRLKPSGRSCVDLAWTPVCLVAPC